MKKISYFLMLMFGVFTLSLTSCDDHDEAEPISEAILPQAAKTFIAQFYSNEQLIGVSMKHDDGTVEYEVLMGNRHKVTFNAQGEWIDVDAPTGQVVPDGIVPAKIADYVSANYPNYGVNEISKESYGYDVELTNGDDLIFNADGDFVRLDR